MKTGCDGHHLWLLFLLFVLIEVQGLKEDAPKEVTPKEVASTKVHKNAENEEFTDFLTGENKKRLDEDYYWDFVSGGARKKNVGSEKRGSDEDYWDFVNGEARKKKAGTEKRGSDDEYWDFVNGDARK